MNREYFICLLVITMHVLGSCEASAQYSPINFFVNLFHNKKSNLPYRFSDLIHTEYRNLHTNNGHSPSVLPPIMRSSVGQCRNIRFRQLYASHVIFTSGIYQNTQSLRGWACFNVSEKYLPYDKTNTLTC